MHEICLTIIVLCLVMIVRNAMVSKFRGKLIQRVSRLANKAIDEHGPWQIYQDAFDDLPGYDMMLWNIYYWRLEKYVKGTILHEGGTDEPPN